MFSLKFWRAPQRRPGVVAVVVVWLATAVVAAGPVDSGRLTRRPVEPVGQALELTLDPSADGFSGRTIVDVVVHAPARVIRLHARDLELGRVALAPRAGGAPVIPAVERGELGLLTLTTPADLSPGTYALAIEFTGQYRRDGVGLYKTEVGGDAYLFTQFEARWARGAFPCWDEPEFKFPWTVTLTVPEGLAAFGNGAIERESFADGRRTVAFARTPPMPTYLVAVAVGPFEAVPVPGMPVPGSIITTRGQSGMAGTVVRETPRIMAALEDYFGIPYPFGKLDQVAVPEYLWGGMENAALITYLDMVILRAPGEDDLRRRRMLVSIVAHEIAHHWYGNLVTMEWWNDLWLNESFATWMEGKVLAAAYPELRYDLHAVGGKERAMRIDALPSTGPVRREITAADDPEKFVDDLSYEKGQAVLSMIEAWIGPDVFRSAMKRYFEKHRWGSARAEDLWDAFSEAAGDDVTSTVESFFEQPGLPQVAVEVLPGDRLRLRQSRYAALGSEMPASAAGALWRVPMVFAYGDEGGTRTARVLVTEREQVVDVPGVTQAAWILPNAGEAGYYRWQLEADREAALVRQAVDALAPIERLGLLGNATAMHDAGALAAGRYLELLVQATRDPVPEVAQRAVRGLMRMRGLYLDEGDDAQFADFCRDVLRPVLDRVGMTPVAGEESSVAELRGALIEALGVRGGDRDVIAMARDLAGKFVRDPRSVDSGLAEAVLTVSAWHGDAAFFDACDQAFRRATVPTDRRLLIGALGGYRDSALCERALGLALGPGLRAQERVGLASGMSGASATHQAMLVDWIIAHFDEIRTLASEAGANALIHLAATPDEAQFERALAFLSAPERINDAAAKNIAETRDRVAQRRALRARGQDEARRFVADFGS